MSNKIWSRTVWSGIVDAVTFSAVSSVAASLAGGAFGTLLANHIANVLYAREKNTNSETVFTVLERAKSELEAAMNSIAQLEKTAKSAQARATDLKEEIATLDAQQKAAQAALKEDEEAFLSLMAKANSRGRARGWVECVLLGTLASLAASAIWLYATKPN